MLFKEHIKRAVTIFDCFRKQMTHLINSIIVIIGVFLLSVFFSYSVFWLGMGINDLHK